MSWLGRIARLAVASVGLTACLQGEGERCQVQSDCGTVNAVQLICVLPPGGSPQTGGFCQLPGSGLAMAGTVDAAMPPDAAMPGDLSQTD